MESQYAVGSFIYDPKVYDGLNTQKEDIDFYAKWINKNNISTVLELCCGTGRITIPLKKQGVAITGLDINEDMLSEAKIKAKKENLAIDFIQGDMRSFSLATKFQLVVIPFNSIHCLYESSDLAQTLRTIAEHLAPDGYMIIDYFNPSISYIVNNQDKSLQIADYTTDDGRRIQINQTMHYEDATQVNRIKWEHIVNGKHSSFESLDMRMYYPQELDYIVTSNDFKIVHKYGDYGYSPFSNASPIQLLICQKA
jgi:2-polyprenyl-3-methyl-5-hydroxy-6-metoxy-1,4-benzoquinol methylase